MPKLQRPASKRKFRLDSRMQAMALHSEDPIVRDVQNTLNEFAYSEVVRQKYNWKYLPDERFQELCNRLTKGTTVYETNRAFLSHLLRVIEAFEIVSIWRATELISTSVDCLNSDRLVAAAVTIRSLIELTAQYGFAANVVRVNFEKLPWQHLREQAFVLDCKDENGKSVGLESFIERLMGGTRIKSLVEINPNMEQKNILTIIEKTDKILSRQGIGYQIMPHYEMLCDMAHPNTVGFQRYLVSVDELEGGWTARLMKDHALGSVAEKIVEECLWGLSFSAGTMNGCFGVFQTVFKNAGTQLGKLLP
jgi:hypothetical protein